MSYVDPKLRFDFESLPIDLKNEILNMDVNLYSMADLIDCLEKIAVTDLSRLHQSSGIQNNPMR